MVRELKLRPLRPGNYHSFLYENESEAHFFALSFIRQGLENKEKVVYVAAKSSIKSFEVLLADNCADLADAIEKSQLRIDIVTETLRRAFVNNMTTLNGYLSTELEDASLQGYEALRVAIDVTDISQSTGSTGIRPFPFFRQQEGLHQKCLTVFMCGTERLQPETLFRIVIGSPSFIIGDDTYDNFLFDDSGTAGRLEMPILTVDHLLGLLKGHRKLEETIRKNNEAIKASVENYRSIFESAANLIATVNKRGEIVDCNKRIEEVLGYAREEVIGRPISTLFHPDHLPRAYETLKEVIKKGASYNKEYRMVKKGGSTVYVSVNTTPLKNEKGKITKVVSIVEDITERKRVQEALLESERRYRRFVEILPDAILTVSDGRIIFANGSAYTLFGLVHPRDLIGRRIEELFDGDCIAPLKECFDAINQKGRIDKPVRVSMTRADGAVVFIEWMGTSFGQTDSNTILLVGRDITDRRLAENLLRESEERYRIAIENSNDGVAILRGETYLYVNKKLADIFGYKNTSELINREVTLTIHPDDQERVLANNRMRQRGGKAPERYEFKGVRKNGSIIHVEVSATPIVYKKVPASLVYIRDITVRKEMEEKLRMISKIIP